MDIDSSQVVNTPYWTLNPTNIQSITSSESSEDDDVFVDPLSDIEQIHDNFSEKSAEIKERQEDKVTESEIQNDDALNSHKIEESLLKRVQLLQATMKELHESLKEETRLWKREREEYELLHERMKLIALEEATMAARVASEAYIIESTKGTLPIAISCLTTPRTTTPFTVHNNLYSSEYYKKLDQIEKLCSDELVKIRQDSDALEPLKKIVSQWSMQKGSPEGDNRNDGVSSIDVCGE